MTAPVALPPPSPALTLHMAAAKLRAAATAARAEVASNDYWDMGWTRGVENAIGGATGALVGIFTPDMVEDLADHLDATAVEAVKHAAGFGNIQEEITDGFPITGAKRILGEAS